MNILVPHLEAARGKDSRLTACFQTLEYKHGEVPANWRELLGWTKHD